MDLLAQTRFDLGERNKEFVLAAISKLTCVSLIETRSYTLTTLGTVQNRTILHRLQGLFFYLRHRITVLLQHLQNLNGLIKLYSYMSAPFFKTQHPLLGFSYSISAEGTSASLSAATYYTAKETCFAIKYINVSFHTRQATLFQAQSVGYSVLPTSTLFTSPFHCSASAICSGHDTLPNIVPVLALVKSLQEDL